MKTKLKKDDKISGLVINLMINKYRELENRTYLFAKDIRALLKKYYKNSFVRNDVNQLLRSSGSIAANYLEANDSLGKKDFLMRLRICKKEGKESKLWLFLLKEEFPDEFEAFNGLIDEVEQLIKIFSSIIKKKTQSQEIF